ncbi:BgTH12-06594 [Blumeria graminis f. sp. triticale]|uniref:BgTH12-06594 n=1 Tax=Blumeria graminis f. sp. triticale TaxID=1689686 RepID=A0A9W4CXX5_BLUGR|nr:BgTH12-06594 [Blumeria graminis f. sp. triticale]
MESPMKSVTTKPRVKKEGFGRNELLSTPRSKSSKDIAIKRDIITKSAKVDAIKTPDNFKTFTRKQIIDSTGGSSSRASNISSSRIPRVPTAANRIPLRSKISKPLMSDSTHNNNTSSTQRSQQALHLKQKKTRKPINEDTFTPVIQKNVYDHSNGSSKSGLDSTEDESNPVLNPPDFQSELSDWEIIDWPWVTPYSPLERITLLSDCNFIKIFPVPRIIPLGVPLDRQPTLYPYNFLRLFADNCSGEDKLRQASLKTTEPIGSVRNDGNVSTHRHIPLAKQSTRLKEPEAITKDPAVISIGPAHSTDHATPKASEIRTETESLDSDRDNTEDESLLKNIEFFIKNFGLKKKHGRELLLRLLQFLTSYGGENNPEEEPRQKFSHKEKCPYSIEKHYRAENATNSKCQLNPNVPEFEPSIDSTIRSCELLQRLSDQVLQQKGTSHGLHVPTFQQDENIEVLSTVKDPVLLKGDGPRADQLMYKFNVPEIEKRPLWVKTLQSKGANTQNKLIGSSLKKLHTLESNIQQPTPLSEIPQLHNNSHHLPNLTTCTNDKIASDLPMNDDGPGRVAKVMDNRWAQQMLEKFRDKYPMTGSPNLDPVTEVNQKVMSDIQQRLEYLLLVKKEKEAYQHWLAYSSGCFNAENVTET